MSWPLAHEIDELGHADDLYVIACESRIVDFHYRYSAKEVSPRVSNTQRL